MGAEKIEIISMGQGNKTSRIVAWTFLTAEEQKEWKETIGSKIIQNFTEEA